MSNFQDLRMAKYIEIVDGVGFTLPAKVRHKLACCDCGLVHDIVLVPSKGRLVGIAMRRNNRATTARRKALEKLGAKS